MVLVHPSTNQQLGVLLAIVEATGSMVTPLHRPCSSFRFVHLGPALYGSKNTQQTYKVELTHTVIPRITVQSKRDVQLP